MWDGVVLDVDSGNAPAYHIYQKLGLRDVPGGITSVRLCVRMRSGRGK